MKKVLIGAMVILSLGVVGCTNKGQDAINVMSVNKAEKVVKSEYVSRLKRITSNTVGNFSDDNEYSNRYSESEISEERFYGPKKDRYKDIVESISTFRTEDEEVNKLHDKLIETYLDMYNMINENIKLGQELDVITKKENMTDSDEERRFKILDKQRILDTMIENQEEHVENILSELSEVLGVN